jgi:hypothetical protein
MTAPTEIWLARKGDLITVPGLHTGPVRVESLDDEPWDGRHSPGDYVRLVWAADGARGSTAFRTDALATVESRELSDAEHAAAQAAEAERRQAETERILAHMIAQSKEYGL